jgi:DNA-directed RNA polymerase subunit RPC12/RpoP
MTQETKVGDRRTYESGSLSKESWEERTCERCGYRRKVKVRRADRFNVTVEAVRAPQGYLTEQEVSREHVDVEEYFSKLCVACDYLERAATHEYRARQYRKKAQAIFKKRGQEGGQSW